MSTYAEIVSILQQRNEDDSTEFSNAIPEILARSEDRIFRSVPQILDHRTAETGTLTSGTNTVRTTATDVRGIRYLYLTVSNSTVFLEERKDEYLQDYWLNSTTTGQPKYYALDTAATNGTTLLLAPTPNTNFSYTLKYTRMPTRLSSSNTTTYVSLNHPDVLIKGAMYESSVFLNREAQMRQELRADFEAEVQKLNAEITASYSELQ
tara:strand:- start:4181 stop:4804 length:624 start_codon:yes stop_codon:yes gene_type:complete